MENIFLFLYLVRVRALMHEEAKENNWLAQVNRPTKTGNKGNS